MLLTFTDRNSTFPLPTPSYQIEKNNHLESTSINFATHMEYSGGTDQMDDGKPCFINHGNNSSLEDNIYDMEEISQNISRNMSSLSLSYEENCDSVADDLPKQGFPTKSEFEGNADSLMSLDNLSPIVNKNHGKPEISSTLENHSIEFSTSRDKSNVKKRVIFGLSTIREISFHNNNSDNSRSPQSKSTPYNGEKLCVEQPFSHIYDESLCAYDERRFCLDLSSRHCQLNRLFPARYCHIYDDDDDNDHNYDSITKSGTEISNETLGFTRSYEKSTTKDTGYNTQLINNCDNISIKKSMIETDKSSIHYESIRFRYPLKKNVSLSEPNIACFKDGGDYVDKDNLSKNLSFDMINNSLWSPGFSSTPHPLRSKR
ncbi:unnamed protein product [Gordionus sp. m RMFG-2023]